LKYLLDQIHTCLIKFLSKTWKKCLSNHEKSPKITSCSFNSLHQKVPLKLQKAWFLYFSGPYEEFQLPLKIWPLSGIKSFSKWPKYPKTINYGHYIMQKSIKIAY
jgi:hypothetical protein